MLAKFGLAESLWYLGKREEAIRHLFEMLELNPNDNQGIRHILSHYLLAMDEGEKFNKLLQQYEGENNVEFLYNNALFKFRQGIG